nr:hypothetical protein [Candidatus Cloacimonadota bacterium]
MNSKRIAVSDLDGTLLPHHGHISDQDLSSLEDLQLRGIITVLATGRSLFSLRRHIPIDAPFDFVIFSTGAGIMDWKTQNLIYYKDLQNPDICKICNVLEASNIDYMLHDRIPDSHFLKYREKVGLADFWNRIEHYREFAQVFDEKHIAHTIAATQFLAVVPQDREDIYQKICHKLYPITPIRTTSPMDLQSLWIEIFAPGVNKGESLKYLLGKLRISASDMMVVGNDYNDLDMLRLTEYAYVTSNAPEDLKKEFRPVSNDNAFTMAMNDWLKAKSC